MPSFKNSNNKIIYNIINPGSNFSSLLLLHDNGQSSRIFDQDLKFYSSYFNVITVDLAGHGKSPAGRSSSGNFWADNAAAITGLLDKIRIQKLSIIGLGGGGLVALNMALLQPKIVRGILVESLPGLNAEENYLNELIAYREKVKSSHLKSLFQNLNGSKWEKILDADTDMQKEFILEGRSFFNGDVSNINCHVMFAISPENDLFPGGEEVASDAFSRMKNVQVHKFSSGKYPLILTKNDEFRTVSLNYLMD